MSNKHYTPRNIITIGNLISELHYGPFLRDWWYFSESESENSNIYPIPLRLGFQVSLKLNQKVFTVKIIRSIQNPNIPGFICEGEGVDSRVLSSSSNAINTAYKKVFGQSKTKYPGATLLGFHDSHVIQQILDGVGFHPFTICLHNSIRIFIVSILDKNNGEGFVSCFMYKYKQKQSVIWQKIVKGLYSISIFQNGKIIKQFQDTSASLVWKQTQLLQNYNGDDLFGINNPIVQFKIKELREKFLSETCNLDDWNNERIMRHMFKLYLKKHIPGDEELWYRVFNRWYNQKSTIIEIKSFIHEVYNDNHEIGTRELRAWRAIFGAVGCKNITPFKGDISTMEFWSRAKDSKSDEEIIFNLYSNGFLNTKLNSTIRNKEFDYYKDTANVFWYSFCESFDANPNGIT
ncbi:unnamed protein product [Rhizophagus irregularis]|nr:unnamed protein product [Rhizophagus irregularis]